MALERSLGFVPDHPFQAPRKGGILRTDLVFIPKSNVFTLLLYKE